MKPLRKQGSVISKFLQECKKEGKWIILWLDSDQPYVGRVKEFDDRFIALERDEGDNKGFFTSYVNVNRILSITDCELDEKFRKVMEICQRSSNAS